MEYHSAINKNETMKFKMDGVWKQPGPRETKLPIFYHMQMLAVKLRFASLI